MSTETKASKNGLGTPQVAPDELHDDAERTRDNLDEEQGGAKRPGAKAAAGSGAGIAGVAAGIAGVLLWRRHQRNNVSRWTKAGRQARSLAKSGGALAKTGAVTGGALAKSGAGRAKARLGK
ncbi:hypothetical protein [Actinomadura macrotermitis]|uniref:Uncharacterized protein n=1 Tax=Actinomadura macrotermitis TaxID=2585200 RepID=A0A7K0C798_9ACTN|nr:hypothetical protein [Actinomadura macrotermitis]MQY09330.1 hypothetical protein [Actinomadura macrotermitis]